MGSRVLVGGILIAAAAIGIGIWRLTAEDVPTVGVGVGVYDSAQLRNLPPNCWIKNHEGRPGNWSRQGHVGMAYDSRRGTLLVFGSDTHGQDWDNAVHEFDPARKRWETHQPVAGPETHRVDSEGTLLVGTRNRSEAVDWYETAAVPGRRRTLVPTTITRTSRAEVLSWGLQRPPVASAALRSPLGHAS